MRKLLLAAMALTVSISVASNVQAQSMAQSPARVQAQVRADLNTYILLDRTGSMSSMWAEALSSVNAYAENVGKSDPSKPFDRHLNTRSLWRCLMLRTACNSMFCVIRWPR